LRDKENTAPIVKSILGDLVAFSSSLPGCPSFHPDQDLGFRMSDSNTPLLIGMFSFLVGDDVALVFKDGAGEATVIIGSAQRALKVSK
jgi:hypothetical protein